MLATHRSRRRRDPDDMDAIGGDRSVAGPMASGSGGGFDGTGRGIRQFDGADEGS